MKTEACELYSRVIFYIFLPNVIKIDPYNILELYRFKIGAFFWDTMYFLTVVTWLYRNACIDVGDVVCCINGIDVTQLRHDDVMSLLEMTSRHPRYPAVLTLRRSVARIASKSAKRSDCSCYLSDWSWNRTPLKSSELSWVKYCMV